MKKATILTLAAILTLNSCDFTSSRNYMGTMAGAEIGGVIGEALGWMSTDRHDGPGKAMLGSVIGTVAGAAIGNSLTKDRNRDERQSAQDYGDYQTGGGAYANGNTYSGSNKHTGANNNSTAGYYAQSSQLAISGAYYQDEDGDGRLGKNETINIIYQVTNTTQRTLTDVVLKVETATNNRQILLSPATTTTLRPGERINYKAKAFCKSKVSEQKLTFLLYASSKSAGTATTTLSVRTK